MARQYRQVVLALCCVLGLAAANELSASTLYVGGDAIGPDNSTTDDTGGFTAVEQDGENLGQPAILFSVNGYEQLEEFRVIVFGLPTSNGDLFFDEFQYRLSLWKSDDYFADAAPQHVVELGQPVGTELVADGTNMVVPSIGFGTAGVAGGGATTYDFSFDLKNLPTGGPSQDLFDVPLSLGDWVIGFQSMHDSTESGILRVSGSVAANGPLPLFSRDGAVPRGILGGQDPDNISIRWGIALGASIPGDFDHDLDVDGDDASRWGATYGEGPIADADKDRDVDGIDFLAWQEYFGNQGPLLELPGDFVPDGFVDEDDFGAWISTFGQGPFGDADDDSYVGATDFLIWQRNFGVSVPALAALSIPEPSRTVLLLLAAIGYLPSRRALMAPH